MKFWATEHTFNHAWEKVTHAIWRKYPNDLNPNVKVMDVLDREVREDGRLHTYRLVGSQWSFPTFVATLLGMPEMCYGLEYSTVDPSTGEMDMTTINMSFSSVLECKEFIKYKKSLTEPNVTHMSQDARISVFGIGFRDYCESAIANGFDSNSSKGRQAVEHVITKISLENIITSFNEEMQELGSTIDNARTLITTELNEITTLLSSEVKQIVDQLNVDLSVLSSSTKLPPTELSLTEAVAKAGLLPS